MQVIGVFDNAVMYYRELPVGRSMGMGINICRSAVSSPASVPNPRESLRQGIFLQICPQIRELSALFTNLDTTRGS